VYIAYALCFFSDAVYERAYGISYTSAQKKGKARRRQHLEHLNYGEDDRPANADIACHAEMAVFVHVHGGECYRKSGKTPNGGKCQPCMDGIFLGESTDENGSVGSGYKEIYRTVIKYLEYPFRFDPAQTVIYAGYGVQHYH